MDYVTRPARHKPRDQSIPPSTDRADFCTEPSELFIGGILYSSCQQQERRSVTARLVG